MSRIPGVVSAIVKNLNDPEVRAALNSSSASSERTEKAPGPVAAAGRRQSRSLSHAEIDDEY